MPHGCVQIEIGGRLGVALANSNLGVLGELQFQFTIMVRRQITGSGKVVPSCVATQEPSKYRGLNPDAMW